MEDHLKYSEKLMKRLENDYANNLRKLKIEENIYRRVNLLMSNSCEDNIARMIKEILDDNKKEYRYIVDVYLSPISQKKLYRPDILIIDKNKNNIVGIVEIKAQMGYCGDLHFNEYEKTLEILNEGVIIKNDSGISKIHNDFWNTFEKDNGNIHLTIDKNVNIFVVTVLTRNHRSNVEQTIRNYLKENKNNNIHYNVLYNESIWYDNLKSENKNELYENGKEYTPRNNKQKITLVIKQEFGFKKFVDNIKKIS